MSEEQSEVEETKVKVVDRRRFTQEGEPAGPEATEGPAPAAGDLPEGTPPAQDPRDARIAAQEARIDDLARAYAALLEEGKASRARLEREKERVLESERAKLANVLLDAADELGRALDAAAGTGASGPLVDGVRLTLAEIMKRVGELGAVRLPTLGAPFDPRTAEAIDAMTVSDASQDGMVLQEVRAGYRIGDRVLRPARVRVGRLARA